MMDRYSKSPKRPDLTPDQRGAMRPMNLFYSLVLFFGLSFVFTPVLFADNAEPWDAREAERDAQEEVNSSERSSQEEMSSSIYGRIISINADSGVLSLLPTDQVENDEEDEEDDEVTSDEYHFKSNTTLTGLDSFSELSPGDFVTLDYYNFQDRNRLLEITFDKHGETKNDTAEAKESSPGVLVG